jgi:hypothetical protein
MFVEDKLVVCFFEVQFSEAFCSLKFVYNISHCWYLRIRALYGFVGHAHIDAETNVVGIWFGSNHRRADPTAWLVIWNSFYDVLVQEVLDLAFCPV